MQEQERQATLLAAYQAALERDPAASVPAGLDPAVAAVARQLAHLSASPEPDPAFVATLARRLDLQPVPAARTVSLPPSGLTDRAAIGGATPSPALPETARPARRGPWTRVWSGANALGTVALVAALAVALAIVLPVMISGGGWGGRGTSPTATASAGGPTSCTGTLAPQKPATPPERPIPATPTGREAELYIPCAFERDPALQRIERAGLVQHLNASQTVDGGTLTVARMYADANRIVVAYTMTGPDWATGDFRLSPSGDRPILTDSAGRTYPYATNFQEGYGGMVNGRQTLTAILAFDGATLPPGATQETFRLSFPEAEIRNIAAMRNESPPQATTVYNERGTPVGQRVSASRGDPEVAGTIGPWSFDFTLPIAPARIAEVNQTITAPVTASYQQGEPSAAVPRCNACPAAPAEGLAITVERVVTTPSETRVYLRLQAPATGDRMGWEVRSIAIEDPASPPEQNLHGQTGTRALPDGRYAIGFSNPLHEKQGEWTLTIGELWTLVPPDQQPDQRGYVQVRLNGQWIYRFTMP